MKKRKIIVTGNLGYVGSELYAFLQNKNFNVIGFDLGFYSNIRKNSAKQILKDLRKATENDFHGVDSVIHLAGLSNDPLGEFSKKLTEDINFSSTVKIAKLSKKMKVKRFIFASTQSIYGISESIKELKEDDIKNPVTAYAKTKLKAENEILKLADNDFTVAIFRPSTVYGSSKYFRSDIIFNNFLSSAHTQSKIEIYGNGKPWRPVIYVKDVCNIFYKSLTIDKSKINKQAFNLGVKKQNYTVKQIAQFAKKCYPNTKIIIKNQLDFDERTYKVNFDKLYKTFNFKPKYDLERGGLEIKKYFKKIDYKYSDFKGPKTNRLLKLKNLINQKKINKNLIINSAQNNNHK